MNDIFECGDKHFRKTYMKNEHDPYRVECIETRETSYDHDSFDNALDNVLQKNSIGKRMKESKYADGSYIGRIFRETLLRQKRSKCNELVEEKMRYGDLPNVLPGKTTEYALNEDETVQCVHYYTDAYNIYALMERGLAGGVTDIIVKER